MIVGWFGYGGGSWMAEQIREELLNLDIQLRTCHEHPNADVKYTPDGIFDFIDSCDVIILPARYKLEPAKSVNRLALTWQMRKPCVIYPLPAYMKYAVHENNVLVTDSPNGMIDSILRLRDDPQLAETLVNNGHSMATKYLHPKTYIDRFMDALRNAKATNPWRPEHLVQIIIPHYADRLDYLTLAAQSALESWGPKRDIFVVSSSKTSPMESMLFREGPEHLRVHHQNQRLSFAEAINLGLKNSHPDATHYLLLNDDTLMGEKALGNMFETLGDRVDVILNPYSNCDKSWLHNDDIATPRGLDLHPNMTIENMTTDDIVSIKKMEPNKENNLVETKFCAMYCTLFHQQALDRIGLLNTNFSNGGEDADWSYRAHRFGFKTCWTKNSWVFHFGGKTRKFAEDENFDAHHEEDRFNNTLLAKRWNPGKKRVCIWTGPAWEKWDLESYKTSGIGGSETCAGRLAETLVENGHKVLMLGAHDEKEQNGVQLLPWNQFKADEDSFDVFIASRNINCINESVKARTALVWLHDIWALSGQHISPYHMARVDKFIMLSPWHQNFASNFHSIPLEKTTIVPNGVNVELFDDFDPDKKKFGRFIFTSSPDRWLDNVLYLMPFIKDKVPEAHLDIFYGFHNYESAVRSRGKPNEIEAMERLKAMIADAEKQGFATNHGRIPQPELAKKWAEAYLWMYASNFTETYCAVPGTSVSMANGITKSIENVKVGDLVVTHTGNQKPVTELMNRPVSKPIYEITPKYFYKSLDITGEHPVLILKRKDARCVRTYTSYCKKETKTVCSGKHEYKGNTGKVYQSKNPCTKLDKPFVPQWVPASELTTDDLVCVPINKAETLPGTFRSQMKFHDFDLNHHAINHINDFEFDEDFMEFCGWYMAEGVFDGKTAITFALHKNEEHEGDFIEKQITKLGLVSRTDVKGNSRNIITHSVILGSFFKPFGRISKDRTIPKWIKDLDKRYLAAFLKGLFHGDGSHTRDTLKLECASETLIKDLFEVMLKFDCVGSMSKTLKKKPIRQGDKIVHSETEFCEAFSITISLCQNIELFQYMGYETDVRPKQLYVKDDDYAYIPIKRIDTRPYDGLVYNFEVADDNSYIANGFAVHNCITAKEAQISGTPIICSDTAALQTTVGEFGHRVPGDAVHYEPRMEYYNAAVRLLTDKDEWVKMSAKAKEGAKNISWGDRYREYWSQWI